MRQANRLILNTLATYVRMVITVGMGLLTTRLLLSGLGIEDYGIYAAVGAGLALLVMINDSLTISVQRHLAFQIGRNDPQATRGIFNTALAMHFGLALVIGVAGLILRQPALHILTIPVERLPTAGLVYDICLVISVVTVAINPYGAVYSARQHMVIEAIFATIGSTLALAVAWLLHQVEGDKLTFFILATLASRAVLWFISVSLALYKFPESRPRPTTITRQNARELGGLMSWTMLGSVVGRSRTEGVGILLNIFFGPTVNAAYSVAIQANTYMLNFVNAMIRALQPVMATMAAQSQTSNMRLTILAANKIGVVLASFVAFCFILFPNHLLDLWLEKVPPNAAMFCVFLVASSLIDFATFGQEIASMAQDAYGEVIRKTWAVVLMPFVATSSAFYSGYHYPIIPVVLMLVSSFCVMIIRAKIGERLFGVTLQDCAREVFLKTFAAIIFSAVAGKLTATFMLDGSLFAMPVALAIYVLLTVLIFYAFVLTHDERARIRGFAGSSRRLSIQMISGNR